MELSRLIEIPLRKIWQNEERHFSTWLSEPENIALLSEVVGVDITVDQNEAQATDCKDDNFTIDIYGHSTDNPEFKIIIENQLAPTDHDHLGKLITYASGKDANMVIWIVSKAREAHRQAIDWLNEHTDDNVDFFLLEIKVYQIGESSPAPKFDVVCKPNDWSKSQKRADNLSAAEKTHLDYWQYFKDYCSDKPSFTKEFSLRKATADHWYDLAVGSSKYHIALLCDTSKNKAVVQFHIPDDKRMYNILREQKESIESEFGLSLGWTSKENKKSSDVSTSIEADWNNRERWDEYSKWLSETSIKMKKVFLKSLKNLED